MVVGATIALSTTVCSALAWVDPDSEFDGCAEVLGEGDDPDELVHAANPAAATTAHETASRWRVL
jgi:hypothetical protein